MSSKTHGIYINLDRATRRRRSMERQLRDLGLVDRYVRLKASDGGEVPLRAGMTQAVAGCFSSHVRALELAQRLGGVVHIAEDDVILSSAAAEFARRLDVAAFAGFDLIFLDMWVDAIDDRLVRRLIGNFDSATRAKRIDLIDMRNLRLAATASYIPNPASIDRLAAMLRAEIAAGPTAAIDVTLNRWVAMGEVRAALTVPFLTGMDPVAGARSYIQTGDAASLELLILLRSLVYVDRDIEGVITPRLARLRAAGAPPVFCGFVAGAIDEARILAAN